MKKCLFLFALVMVICVASAQAARIPVTYGEHEKIEKVADLPDEYVADDGAKIDLGYKYTMFEIAFVPLWQTDEGKVVGYDTNNPDSYYDMDELLDNEESCAAILEAAGADSLESLCKRPFWDAWGGKLVALVAILLVLYGVFGRDKTKKSDENEVVAAE